MGAAATARETTEPSSKMVDRDTESADRDAALAPYSAPPGRRMVFARIAGIFGVEFVRHWTAGAGFFLTSSSFSLPGRGLARAIRGLQLGQPEMAGVHSLAEAPTEFAGYGR